MENLSHKKLDLILITQIHLTTAPTCLRSFSSCCGIWRPLASQRRRRPPLPRQSSAAWRPAGNSPLQNSSCSSCPASLHWHWTRAAFCKKQLWLQSRTMSKRTNLAFDVHDMKGGKNAQMQDYPKPFLTCCESPRQSPFAETRTF